MKRKFAEVVKKQVNHREHLFSAIPANYVTNVIERISTFSENLGLDRLNEDYIHVSDLIRVCPREYVLSVRYSRPRRPFPKLSDRLVWAIGRAVEDVVRKQFIMGKHFQRIMGRWKCNCGRLEYDGWHRSRHKVCRVCHDRPMVYTELPLSDSDYGIVGSPDLVFFNSGKAYIVEIKSMTKTMFDDLSQPLGDHILQVMMYRYLARKNNIPLADRSIFVYVRKEYQFSGVVKEFHHPYRDSDYEEVLQGFLRIAEEIRGSFSDRTVPVRECCSSRKCARARKCLLADICFSTES